MRTVNVAEARRTLSELLKMVARGEEVVITRYGKEIARITPASPGGRFPDMAAFRARIHLLREPTPAGQLLREMREEERY